MGDFNFDLLQYETRNLTDDFLTTVTSHSFLPYVLQPTRVTEHSSTVIDNIFSSITDFEIISANINKYCDCRSFCSISDCEKSSCRYQIKLLFYLRLFKIWEGEIYI